MNNWLFLAFLSIGAISCAHAQSTETVVPGVKTTPGVVTNISVDQLAAALAADSSIHVLDVRSIQEYVGGHIANAKQIDILQNEHFKEEIQKLDKNHTYWVYCRSGHRSLIAADEMIRAGFTSVINVEGGFNAWSARKKE
ncbi:MAG: rhodanese-like domain-containing protein [Saprospiraceae bacterium]|nr:rhodanese-like domain-containing protein [Saprospiraceae bacterium]MCB9318668.1 rhodanese-like domain-containing protein [Lewinellaceae bacterium]